jgi:hypothetical protein
MAVLAMTVILRTPGTLEDHFVPSVSIRFRWGLDWRSSGYSPTRPPNTADCQPRGPRPRPGIGQELASRGAIERPSRSWAHGAAVSVTHSAARFHGSWFRGEVEPLAGSTRLRPVAPWKPAGENRTVFAEGLAQFGIAATDRDEAPGLRDEATGDA